MAELRSDDELLAVLSLALAPPAAADVAPSVDELVALRSVVRESAARSARARTSRWQRRVAVVLVGGVVLSGGTAYATSSGAPRPVRSAAFALKLPVEAPDLTDAKDAIADLEEALAAGRRDHVAAAAEDVREELAELTPSQRASLEPHVSTLLASADRQTQSASGSGTSGSGSTGSSSGSGGSSGSGTSGSSGSGTSGSDGSGSSGSGSSGSGSSGSGSGSSGSSGSGSSGSGSGSSGSGGRDDGSGSDSGSSGSGASDDGSSGGSGGSGSGSSGDGSSGSGTSGSSGSGTSGSGDE